VKKLVNGQGVAAVARWCHELNPEGELHNKTHETWRKYLTPVAMRIRNDLKPVKRFKVEPLAYSAWMEELDKQKVAMTEIDPVAEPARSIWPEVTKAVRELDAEAMLKYCFLIQQVRVQAMLELEEKMNLLMPHGYKEVAVLMKIAAEVRKYEVGEQRMKGNGKAPDTRGFSNGPLPPGQTGEASRSEEPRRQLDEAERDRVHAAGIRVVDMIMKEVS
jgi:hypothetical protein